MKRLHKFLRLTSSERLLLINSMVLLGGIRVGLWLLPFQTLRHILANVSSLSSELRETNEVSVNDIVLAITTIDRFMRGTKCLCRALATQILLSRYGYAGSIRIGVAKSKHGKLEAHAWVESQGRIIIGDLRELSRYVSMPHLDIYNKS
jgi:hypothetical protein